MIERCRDAYPVRMMCRLLSVSPGGHYAWACRTPSAREAANFALLDDITDELNMKGFKCSINRVARLVKARGMQGIP